MFTIEEIKATAEATADAVRDNLREMGDDETPVKFSGQYAILGHVDDLGVEDDRRLIVFLDSSVPGAGYGEWYGENADGEMISSDDFSDFL